MVCLPKFQRVVRWGSRIRLGNGPMLRTLGPKAVPQALSTSHLAPFLPSFSFFISSAFATISERPPLTANRRHPTVAATTTTLARRQRRQRWWPRHDDCGGGGHDESTTWRRRQGRWWRRHSDCGGSNDDMTAATTTRPWPAAVAR